MLTIATTPEMPSLVMHAYVEAEMTADEFFEFCQLNRDFRIERTAEGEIIMRSPAGGETGNRNAALTAALFVWAKQHGRGVAFDSSTGFILPNGAMRAPDAAWVDRSRLQQLTSEQKRKFLPLCPDFVIELLSPTDRLQGMQTKMEEYREHGVQLGWLIDPSERQVFIYRPRHEVVLLPNPARIMGDPELAGFTLDLTEIWEPDF